MKIRYHLMLLLLTSLLLTGCGTLEFQLETPDPQSTPGPAGSATPDTLTVLPTQNLSETVAPQPPPSQEAITSITMIDTTQGWAVVQPGDGSDRRIVHTMDGGMTWQDVTPALAPAANGVGRKVSAMFQSAVQAWVSYENQPAVGSSPEAFVWFTADGGKTWSKSQALDFSGAVRKDYYEPGDLGFLDEQHGWLLAHLGIDMQHDYFAIFTSADGGMTWQRQADPAKDSPLMACPKTGLTFQNPTEGWLTGSCGVSAAGAIIYQTDDGGNTWKPVNLPAPASRPGVFTDVEASCEAEKLVFSTAQSATLPVRCGFSATQEVYRWVYTSSAPGSGEWVVRDAPEVFGSFDFLDASTGWMLAMKASDPTYTTLFKTEDSAQTWTSVTNLNWSGKLDFVDAQNGWAVAPTADGAALMRTQDGGATWQQLESRIIRPSLSSSSGDSGLSFKYGSLASGSTVQTIPAVTADTNPPYWQVFPQHLQITLNGYPVGEHAVKPQIFLYPVEETRVVNAAAAQVIADLQAQIQTPQETQSMPFLPLINTQQMMHAQVKSLAFQNGTGVRYLTQFAQGAVLVNNDELVYTFQGLTGDGKYYVAAVLPVTHPSLPADTTITGKEPKEFTSNFPKYLSGQIAALNTQPADSFTPSLAQLDAVLNSVEVKE